MTRPFRVFHDYASQFGNYTSQDGELICGSLMEPTVGHLMRALKAYEMPHGAGLLHTTLSAPEGRHYAYHQWHEIACFVLERSGLPPRLTPWMAAGREAKGTDHIHIISACQTWSGRPLEIQTSVRATDQLAIDLSHRLGFAEPAWLPPGTNLLVHPIRKGAKEPVRDFANDVNMAIDLYLPTSTAELDDALASTGSHWRVRPSDMRAGLLTTWNEQTGDIINPKLAGTAFSSARLTARLALAAQVRLHRVACVLRNLARFLPAFQIPTLKKDNTNDPHEFRRARAGEQDRSDAQGSQNAPPAPRPVGSAGHRSNDKLRRTASGIHARDRDELQRPDSPVRGLARGPAQNGHSAGQPERETGVFDSRSVARGPWLLRFYRIAHDLGLRLKHRFWEDGKAVTLRLDGEAPCVFAFDGAEFRSDGWSPAGSTYVFQEAVCEVFKARREFEGTSNDDLGF